MDLSGNPTYPLQAYPRETRWKNVASHAAALITAILFISSGVWKASDPFRWAQFAEQLFVPAKLSMAAALALAISETLAGVLILIPRFRRWGAILAVLLLVVFMLYIGAFYSRLAGQDCSCFPLVKRAINPAFFIEDFFMLVIAFIAGSWTRPSFHLPGAAWVTAGVVLVTGIGYGSAVARQTGAKAPDSIVADGKTLALNHGHFFIYFFDPECGHCNAGAKTMSTLKWKSDVTIVGVPTRQQRWAQAFMNDNQFKGQISLDAEKLRNAFPFGDTPYGVVIENGRQTGAVAHYEENGEPAVTLRQLGVID